MLQIKSLLAGICLTLSLFNVSGAPTGKLTFLYKGKPLCNWAVELHSQHDAEYLVMAHGVTDENGTVTFENVKLDAEYLYVKAQKKMDDGVVKKWKLPAFLKYDKNYGPDFYWNKYHTNNATYSGFGETVEATIDFVDVLKERAETPLEAERDWGLGDKYNEECRGSSSSNGSESLTKDINEMRALQKDLAAARKAELEQEHAALKEKIARLNQRVDKTKSELAALTPGTVDHSNKSYDLRDLELERDMAELELDRNLDEQSHSGQLNRSDKQRYNDKTKTMQEEQKQLAKNRKDGVMYGQKPLSKEEAEAKKKADEKAKEKEEDESTLKFYTAEELANMSSFDLKRTKLSNNQSISKRKVKLKTKAAFLSQDEKTKTQVEIDELTKQVDAIIAVLEKRNEKEE